MASNASSEKKRQVETGSEEEGKFSKVHYQFFLYLHHDFWIRSSQNFIRFVEDPNFK